MFGTKRRTFSYILILIAVVHYTASTISTLQAKSKEGSAPQYALAVVNDDQVLHGSHFEARKRKFSIGEFNVTIRQNWRNLGLGCVVWPAAELLSILLHDKKLFSFLNIDVRDKFVVELGAGTGLPAIIAALSGARLSIATDRNEIIEKCTKKNIDSVSEHQENLNLEVLDWDSDSSGSFVKNHGTPDIIIGADLIYHESAFAPLVETLLALSEGNTQIIITGKERYKRLNQKFLNLLGKFEVTKFGASNLGKLVSDTRDYVYVITRNDATCDM